MRVLVTDGETRSVLAVVRGLHAAGFEVAVTAAESQVPAPAHWSRAASARLSVPHPLEHEAAFVAAIERAVASRQYAVVVPGSDASLLAISRARDAIERYSLLGLPPHDVVERSLNKHEVAVVASRHGLDAPATILCSGQHDAVAAAQELGFPVLAKPVCSIVERGGVRYRIESRRADDEEALLRTVADYGERFLVQRAEGGAVLSFAGVFADGKLFGEALSKYRRTWRPEAGNVAFSETVESRPALTERVVSLLEDLGWEGLFELELIERGHGDWAAVDFNPRPYGSLALAIGAGANLPAVWCSVLLGRQPLPVQARPGVTYRWEDADLRHALWQLRRRRPRAAAQVLRIRPGTVHPYLVRSDPGPLAARAIGLAKALRHQPGILLRSEDSNHPRVSAALTGRNRARPDKARQAVIIGAGPYGLAAAAFLREAGVSVRSFGDPLDFWRYNMPAGMILRSLRRATHIADPGRNLTIDRYEQAEGKSLRTPSLLLGEFIEYGMWFAQRVTPDLDRRRVVNVARENGLFQVRLEDGTELEASHVVVAAGLAGLAARPAPFASLEPSLISHTSDHDSLEQFANKRVVVVGGGQSALESAALLSECGATVEVLVRRPGIKWLRDDTVPAARRQDIGVPPPPTGVGGRVTGWVAAIPDAFRHLPAPLKPWISTRCIAPAGSGWLRPRLNGVTITCGRFATQAEAREGQIWMLLNDGSERVVDHILLGTGYAIDVTRYSFLAPTLAAEIARADGYPLLGPGLESSVPGLHFLGAPAALSFGPIMRFVVGTWYAAPALRQRVLDRRQPPVRFSF